MFDAYFWYSWRMILFLDSLYSVETERLDPATLQTLCLKAFQFSLEEAVYFCERYRYSFIRSDDKEDVAFRDKLKQKESFLYDFSVDYPKPDRQAIILEIIKSDNTLTQEYLSSLLNVSRETIIRDFKELKIQNIGSKKKPKWHIAK